MTTNLGVPPPITGPHFIILAILSLRISVYFFGHKMHYIGKAGVAHQVFHTLDWVSSPELEFLRDHLFPVIREPIYR
jgi:hypothetical protein